MNFLLHNLSSYFDAFCLYCIQLNQQNEQFAIIIDDQYDCNDLMGNNQNDTYFSQKPINVANSLKNKNIYYWVDEKIFQSQQKKAYLTVLKDIIQIRPIDMWKRFIFQLDSLEICENQAKIFLITSLSLPEEAFTIFQSQTKIFTIIIYDFQLQYGQQIILNHPKIKKRFKQFEDLLNQIRQIQACSKQSIYFYYQQDIERLNQWMVNWLALRDFSRQKGKKDFLQLARLINFSPNEVKRYEKTYDINKIQLKRDRMVLQQIALNNFFLTIPSEILCKCKDTFTLSLIRQPLFDIYHAIKANYALSLYQQVTVYTRISLNRYQINILKSKSCKYAYFSTFMICSLDPGRKRSYQNQFRLAIKLKRKLTNNAEQFGGFCINANQIIINIDNAFEILNADLQKGQILMELVQFSKDNQKSDKQLISLQKHRHYIKYLINIIPGQILPSYLNRQLAKYKQFTQNQLFIIIRNADRNQYYTRKIVTKLQNCKLKLYFHLQSEVVVEQQLFKIKQIIYKLQNEKNILLFKVKTYFMLMQTYFRMNEFIKFGKCIGRLKLLQKQSNMFNQQQCCKLKMYSVYCYICTNKSHIQQNRDLVDELQTEFNKKFSQNRQVSELYCIIMLVKIKCEDMLGNHNKALSLFDQLIKSIKICQGINSVYNYYQQQKHLLQQRIFKIIDSKQRQYKKKIVTSSIPLQQLFTNQNFTINLKGMDLNLYQLQ